MALSNDQRALLRLLAQREEGYEDIAALLGLSVPEVRSRVREALTELDSPQSAPPEATPTKAPSPPAHEPPPDPSEPRVARRRGSPVTEEPAKRDPSPRGKPLRQAPHPKRPGLPQNRRRLLELIGGALVVLLLVLFATGAVDIGGNGDDDDSSDAALSADGGGNVTQAELAPPEGGDATGRAVFGRVGKGPVLQVSAEGLEPSGDGESYTIWLYRTPKLVLRLGAVKVGEEGGIAAQLPVPVELLTYVAGGAFTEIRISRTDDAAYRQEILRARQGKRLPAYSGETVLQGEIAGPLVRR